MKSIKSYLKNTSLIGVSLLFHFFTWLPDRLYLRILFRLRMGYKLNLEKPQTFSEKLQWLKLYNRREEYTNLVDKYAVKDYVARIIGSEYLIPTIGVWEKPEDIKWSDLPNQFVLKTTHGGGSCGVIICTNKDEFDIQKAINSLNKSLKQDIYKYSKEWP